MNIGKYIQLYSEDLRLKNYSRNTIENYCSQIRLFLKYFSKQATKPSEIPEREIKKWLLLAKSTNTRKQRISAVKLFYSLTGKQPLKMKHIEYPRAERKLPVVLSQDEIQRMFDVCKNRKHRVILALLYSCGLRVSELINLKWSHIDRSRMIINIVQAKGNKDRQIALPPTIIPLLETYWKEYKTRTFVLAGQKLKQYSETSVNNVVKELARQAGVRKQVHTHLIRHCTFTHMVEQGTDINLIQKIAGHRNVKTTMIYCHISDSIVRQIPSPIAQLKIHC